MQKQQNIPVGVSSPPVHLHRPPTPAGQDLRGELLGNGYSLVGAPAIHYDQFITRGQGDAPEGRREMVLFIEGRHNHGDAGRGRRRDHGASVGHCVTYPEAATTQDLCDAENAQRSGIEAPACVHDGG